MRGSTRRPEVVSNSPKSSIRIPSVWKDEIEFDSIKSVYLMSVEIKARNLQQVHGFGAEHVVRQAEVQIELPDVPVWWKFALLVHQCEANLD